MRLVFSELKESSNMSFIASASRVCTLTLGAVLFLQSGAFALDLDWHGQFRAEENVLFGYTHDVGATPNNGYTIPNNGDSPATFQNLFFRLNPRVLVNDNVSLHSDIWLGAPDSGLFGSSAGAGSYYYHSTNTGNVSLTARTLFAELASDFGTIRVGRVPLNWGLGIIWNAKEKGFDRLPSNGDGISMVTKLGAFKFSPAIIKYQNANASNVLGTPSSLNSGNAGVSDYTASLMYNNDDEQIDLGIMFMRRIAGQNANVVNPFSVNTPSTSGFAYNVWDFFVKKKAGIVNVGVEVPLVTGLVASRDYSTVAGALKADAQVGERWNLKLNMGSANGQDNGVGGTPDKLTVFSFHPDYRPGFLMFNYNYRNIASGVGSPYNNPVTNARFLALGADYTLGKWTHGVQGLYAIADKTANGAAGDLYYNYSEGRYDTQAGGPSQQKGLGMEFDYRLSYDWDESIHFGLDSGFYIPGKFYEFSNSASTNSNKTVFGTNLSMLVQF